jgi:hypothetical protein
MVFMLAATFLGELKKSLKYFAVKLPLIGLKAHSPKY